MPELNLADFYCGWSIEVIQEGQGFSTTCYSPSRQRLIDNNTYSHPLQALRAAKQAIDHQLVGSMLSNFLREMYETETLCFEEWQRLMRSLSTVVNAS